MEPVARSHRTEPRSDRRVVEARGEAGAELAVEVCGGDRADGRRVLTVTTGRKGVKIAVAAKGGDLSRIAREDHFVTFGLEAPLYRTSYTRRWLLRGRRLRPVG